MPPQLPLSPQVFHILLALAGGERHGYGIIQDVERETAGGVRLGPGTLYGALRRLEQAGWVEETARRADSDRDDYRRRYYGLTDAGERILAAEVRRLDTALRRARRSGILPARAS